MFQERLDNGRKREVQRSCDTPTVQRSSAGACGTRATPGPGTETTQADAATTATSSSVEPPLPRRGSSEARLSVPVNRCDSDPRHLGSPSMDFSSIPWSTAEIDDLKRAMVEHGRVGAPPLINVPWIFDVVTVTDRWSTVCYSAGRWNSIRGDSRYRFHPSRTAANLQQKGRQLLSDGPAGVGRSGPGLRQRDDDHEGRDAVPIGVGVTDTSCGETGPGRRKRARPQTEQPALVR